MGFLTKEQENAMNFVSEFENRTRRFEWIVDTNKANNILLPNKNALTLRARLEPPESLGTVLANSLRYYRTIEDLASLGNQALIVKKWIDYAWDQGVISEGQGITGKLQDCEKEQERLKGDITSLKNQLTIVSDKNTRLEKEKKDYKPIRKELENKK